MGCTATALLRGGDPGRRCPGSPVSAPPPPHYLSSHTLIHLGNGEALQRGEASGNSLDTLPLAVPALIWPPEAPLFTGTLDIKGFRLLPPPPQGHTDPAETAPSRGTIIVGRAALSTAVNGDAVCKRGALIGFGPRMWRQITGSNSTEPAAPPPADPEVLVLPICPECVHSTVNSSDSGASLHSPHCRLEMASNTTPAEILGNTDGENGPAGQNPRSVQDKKNINFHSNPDLMITCLPPSFFISYFIFCRCR